MHGPATIGIISDTHGMVRSAVEKTFSECDHILHAGDVGDKQVLQQLEQIAPVVAVRGNMDRGLWANSLPVNEMVEIKGACFYILHDLNQLDVEPAAAGIHMVISGHTHQPEIFQKDGVTYLNPGSAGPRRFKYPVSVAIVRIENGHLSAQLIEIDP